jgi:hypothetical protein
MIHQSFLTAVSLSQGGREDEAFLRQPAHVGKNYEGKN